MRHRNDVTTWKNYEEKKVGLQVGNRPRVLVEPEEALAKAEILEERLSRKNMYHGETRECVERIRENAKELKSLKEG